MTKPIKAAAAGLKPHYKVRIALLGGLLHLASWDEPHRSQHDSNVWEADWISDPDYGDTLGFIHWEAVTAITWRWSQ